MRLFKRKPLTFDIQVQDVVLHITARTDLDEESRAAALSFWEQLEAYALRNPDIRTSKRPIRVPADAPDIVREKIAHAPRGACLHGHLMSDPDHPVIIVCSQQEGRKGANLFGSRAPLPL